MNIYQITDENDIMELLYGKYKNNITFILFVNGCNNHNNNLKKILKRNLVKNYPDLLFLYVNIESYNIDTSDILENVDNQHYPYVSIYWNTHEMGNIKNADREALFTAIEQICDNVKKYTMSARTESDLSTVHTSENNAKQKNEPVINVTNKLNTLDNSVKMNNNIYNVDINNIDINNDELTNNANMDSADTNNVNDEYIDNQNIMYNIEKMEKLDNLRKIHIVKELDRIIELQEKTSK